MDRFVPFTRTEPFAGQEQLFDRSILRTFVLRSFISLLPAYLDCHAAAAYPGFEEVGVCLRGFCRRMCSRGSLIWVLWLARTHFAKLQ